MSNEELQQDIAYKKRLAFFKMQKLIAIGEEEVATALQSKLTGLDHIYKLDVVEAMCEEIDKSYLILSECK